ncbi:MAG: hypothetical protein IPO21_14735 [Bacteroidales bacterium]|nr:hypothetical protein [Bacteroidales bacterium]
MKLVKRVFTSKIQKKETTPPKLYTEATLLRAMETAGKTVQDEDLRDVMKENGIGRPSTRANIIETLFKRNYVQRQKKNLVPTPTGVELIKTIQNDLLKSVELTGIWESKLRKIEKGAYDVAVFMDEMKQMVNELVSVVKLESGKRITIISEDTQKKKNTEKKPKNYTPKEVNNSATITCPVCGKGTIKKGKTAYGCSLYNNGCNFLIHFIQFNKTLTDKQVIGLLDKRKTAKISGFSEAGITTDGILILGNDGKITLQKIESAKKPKDAKDAKPISCPICKKGHFVKGNSAFGCSNYAKGCKTIIPFSVLQDKYASNDLTTEIVKSFFTDAPSLF